MRYGLSMFGLGPIFKRDPALFLERITAMGYGFLEPCVMAQQIPQLKDHMWTFADLEKYYPMLRSYGVAICSLHVYPRDLSNERQELVALAQKYGVSQLVIPCPQFESAEQGRELAKKLTYEADKMQEAGIQLLLHNGKAECTARTEGMSNYEWLLDACGENVLSQADVGWLLHGGTDPEEFLLRNRDRVGSLHYKDMEMTDEGMKEIGVGRGLVDMTACFRFAKETDIVQLVDQDSSRGDFMEDLGYVAQRLKELSLA